MLNAVIHGKAGRLSSPDGNRISWRDLYTTSEDLLTASVFERLTYLPVRHFMTILRTTFSLELPHLTNPRITRFNFWPRWTPPQSSGRSYVEPDAYFRFEDTDTGFQQDFILEVKPVASATSQYSQQWFHQIAAYRETENTPPDGVKYLALGGLGHSVTKRFNTLASEVQNLIEEKIDVTFHGSDWIGLRRSIEKVRGLEG